MTPRLFLAGLLALAPDACGGWKAPPHAPLVASSQLPGRARHLPLRAALQTSSTDTDTQRQSDQVRTALATLLPGFADASDQAAELEQEMQPSRPLPGTLNALTEAQDAEALAEREKVLDEAYERCRVITAHYAKTFYFGTSFFSEEKRRAVWAVYAWCRRTDDIVDKPRKETVSLRNELAEWRARLNDVYRGLAHDSIDLALVDTFKRYPELSKKPFEDMIKGMVMDLDQNRFETFDELYLYCYRVSGTVGLMTMPIMGTAPGSTYEEALEPALALGVALQLTNILRDVGEDRVRQRIYIPQEDLRRFGVTEASLLKGVKDDKYVALLKFQIERARKWYKVAEDGIPMLAEDARLPVRASLDMYSSILDKIEKNDYDNFNKRAYTSKVEKLMMIPMSFVKVKTGSTSA